MSGPNDFDEIATSILHATQDNVVIISMLLGAGLESSWRINAAGGGAFQIIDAARPSAPFGAFQIDSDVEYMLPRYQAAATAHSKEPESADKYANIAFDAEKPGVPYRQSQGARVDTLYHTVVVNYGVAGAMTTAPVITTNPIAGFLQPVVTFLSQLTDIRLWRSLGWIGFGLILLVLGLIIWFRKPIEHAVGTAAKVAMV